LKSVICHITSQIKAAGFQSPLRPATVTGRGDWR
jgi:hypothetical protein